MVNKTVNYDVFISFFCFCLINPLEKYYIVKLGSSSPIFGVKIKDDWNHQLVLFFFCPSGNIGLPQLIGVLRDFFARIGISKLRLLEPRRWRLEEFAWKFLEPQTTQISDAQEENQAWDFWGVVLVVLVVSDLYSVVVSKILYFHPFLGKWSNLTNIFQMDWNHELVDVWWFPTISHIKIWNHSIESSRMESQKN